MNNILKVEKLKKTIGSFQLHDISFFVPQGCITGIIGLDGSGKSTILKCLINLIKRDCGHIEFWGCNIDEAEQKIKNRVGIVLEGNEFYENLTIHEAKELFSGAYADWKEDGFQKCWNSWGNNEYSSKQKISSLSKKERLIFSISLALAHDSELLILDDPLRGFDPMDCADLLKIFREFVKYENRGILITSQNGAEINTVVDMLVLVDDGHLIFQEEKDCLLEKHRRIKGSSSMLKQIPEDEFLRLEKNNYGFSGICKDYSQIRSFCKNLTVERSSVPEKMMTYLWRRNNV